MVNLPALSYGLFHAQVRPNKLYGIVTTGITMEGLNIDVGHLRHIRWTQDDNPQSAINNEPELTHSGRATAHNRWIAYNKMRGQYSSAMEHAIPEQFRVDRNKCSYLDDKGNIKNPSLQPCAEAISAVKAIAIAQSQGQKIYTINKDNAQTALPKLTGISAEIRSAIEAGKEVTFHEKAISAHGWSGQGYIIVDPETGAGAYLIEGKGNGGDLSYSDAELTILILQSIDAVVQIILMTLFSLPSGVAGLLSSMVSSLFGLSIGTGAVALMHSNADRSCLTEEQKASFSWAVSLLSLLTQWAGFASFLVPGVGVITSVGLYMGLTILLQQTIRMIRISIAIGDCGLQ